MEHLATIILVISLASVASADFSVSSRRDMRWVVKQMFLDIILTFVNSHSASWRCGFFLVSASDGLPRATYFVVQQHFPAVCPAKIFRTRNMEKDCKTQVGRG